MYLQALIRWVFESLSSLRCSTQDADASLHGPALEAIRTHIRTATSSMTSVPKPLKFLRPHYDKFKAAFAGYTDDKNKVLRLTNCMVGE